MPVFRAVTPLLKTKGIAATIHFYTEILGFSVATLWPVEQPTFCILERDEVCISFMVDNDGHYQDSPCLTGQICIDVEDVKGWYAQLEGKVEVLWGPEVYSYGRREFAIRDVNGYSITFGEDTTDPPTTPEP